TPGGRHADNATENKLICFADGSYIELIAFLSSPPPSNHWWGLKPYGIIDFAFTTTNASAFTNYETVSQRLKDIKWEDGE
ncbi:hypothetical protein LSUE1_G010379, partial [Lachnellula suecica]